MLMQPLHIPPSADTPYVHFEPSNKMYLIRGKSMMENAAVFYTGIIDWLEKFEKTLIKNIDATSSPQNHRFVFRLDYFNTSSGKFLFEIVEIIDRIYTRIEDYNFSADSPSSVKIQIEWHYHQEDEIMKAVGDEMQDLTELCFEFSKVG